MARLAEDRLADRAAGLGEHLERLVGRHVARPELHLGDRAIVAPQEGDQQLGEIAARVGIDPAHDAEIDRHDAALAVDEGVAAMHVGMEEAVAEHLVEEGLGGLAHDDVGIVAGGDDGVAVADRDAVDPLLGHHPLRGAVPVDRRRAIVGIVAEVLAQLLRGGGFHAQVHLDPHHVGEGLDRFDRPQPAEARLGALDQLGHPVEEVEIAREGRLDAGPQDLDRDGAAVGRGGEVDLRDRGGGDRRVVEARVQRLDRLAELELDGAPRQLAGKRPADGPAAARDRPRPPRSGDRRASTAPGRA